MRRETIDLDKHLFAPAQASSLFKRLCDVRNVKFEEDRANTFTRLLKEATPGVILREFARYASGEQEIDNNRPFDVYADMASQLTHAQKGFLLTLSLTRQETISEGIANAIFADFPEDSAASSKSKREMIQRGYVEKQLQGTSLRSRKLGRALADWLRDQTDPENELLEKRIGRVVYTYYLGLATRKEHGSLYQDLNGFLNTLIWARYNQRSITIQEATVFALALKDAMLSGGQWERGIPFLEFGMAEAEREQLFYNVAQIAATTARLYLDLGDSKAAHRVIERGYRALENIPRMASGGYTLSVERDPQPTRAELSASKMADILQQKARLHAFLFDRLEVISPLLLPNPDRNHDDLVLITQHLSECEKRFQAEKPVEITNRDLASEAAFLFMLDRAHIALLQCDLLANQPTSIDLSTHWKTAARATNQANAVAAKRGVNGQPRWKIVLRRAKGELWQRRVIFATSWSRWRFRRRSIHQHQQGLIAVQRAALPYEEALTRFEIARTLMASAPLPDRATEDHTAAKNLRCANPGFLVLRPRWRRLQDAQRELARADEIGAKLGAGPLRYHVLMALGRLAEQQYVIEHDPRLLNSAKEYYQSARDLTHWRPHYTLG